MSIDSGLDYLFHPRSIAVIGVSKDLAKITAEGRRFMQSLINVGFKGKIYPVNTSGGEILGLRIYPTIRDIPDTVDYAIATVPARHALQVVKDCAAKGVKAIQFYTAGFGEIEDEEGSKLEAELLRIARHNGLRIIGPNCVGLYCPRTGLSFGLDYPRESGPLGFIAQSGGNSNHLVKEAFTMGIHLSKVISYGNAIDLNESDFLEYLTHDPETRIIGIYIEGVKDGPRFARALRAATMIKPVVICKGGTTDTGISIAASHTGIMAGSNKIWHTLFKQSGAITASNIEEIVDVARLFLRSPGLSRGNVVVIGIGGAASVQAADECSSAGLVLPLLPRQVRNKLRDIHGKEAGHIFRNPLDIAAHSTPGIIQQIVQLTAKNDQIDLFIMHLRLQIFNLTDSADRRIMVERQIDSILELNRITDKPVVVALHSVITDEDHLHALETRAKLRDAGIPVYPSIARAASAVHRLVQYNRWRQEMQNEDI